VLYAILCYHRETEVFASSKEQEAATMERLLAVEDKLRSAGRLGPVAQLMPTTAATTLRKDRDPPLILDGPFAETKEQLLGFFLIDGVNLEEVVGIAEELGRATPGGAFEIRPLRAFRPGATLSAV
jgi:hypothetical protein